MALSKYEFLQELYYFSQANNQTPNYVRDLKSTTARVPMSEKLRAKAKKLDTKMQLLMMSGRYPRIWMARRRRDDKVREPYLSSTDQIADRETLYSFS